jgi:hypothetical protein
MNMDFTTLLFGGEDSGLALTSNFAKEQYCIRSRDSVVGIATGYGLDDRVVGVRVQIWSGNFSSSRRPDGLCDPINLLLNEYQGLFTQG